MSENPEYVEEIINILGSLATSVDKIHTEHLGTSETFSSIEKNLSDIAYQMEVTQSRRTIMERFEDAANEFNSVEQMVEAACLVLERCGVVDISNLPVNSRYDLYNIFPSCTEYDCRITHLPSCGNCKSLIFANEELRHLHVHEEKQKEKKRKTNE